MCMCLHDLESGHLLEFCTVAPHLAVLAEPAMSLGGLELAFLGLGYLRPPNSLVRNYIFLTVSILRNSPMALIPQRLGWCGRHRLPSRL